MPGKFLVVASLAAAIPIAAGPAAAADDELQRALDGVLHPVRIAFFEKAPLFTRISMRKAVRAVCATYKPPIGDKKTARPGEWLCSGRSLAYFRAVAVTGARGAIGYVCDAAGVVLLRYYPPHVLDEMRCLSISSRDEGDRQAYFIEPEALEASESTP